MASDPVLAVDGVPDGTGADDLFPQLDAVGTIRTLASNHPGMVLRGDLDSAQLVAFVCQAGMTFGAFLRLEQCLERQVVPSFFRHGGVCRDAYVRAYLNPPEYLGW